MSVVAGGRHGGLGINATGPSLYLHLSRLRADGGEEGGWVVAQFTVSVSACLWSGIARGDRLSASHSTACLAFH